jgi:hypothetical protein
MRLKRLRKTYAFCRLPSDATAPILPLSADFHAVVRTGDELTIVCCESQVPACESVEGGWACFRVEGPLDFSLVGIISGLAGVLASSGIALCTLSSFDTDYLFVKADRADEAAQAWREAGHEII